MSYENQCTQVQARRERLMREAEQRRLAEANTREETTTSSDETAPIYGPLLAQAGKTMITVGARLYARYTPDLVCYDDDQIVTVRVQTGGSVS